METFTTYSCIRGHHVYKDIWSPITGEQLPCERESRNTKDPYAVAVMRESTVVGHVPRKISAVCALFLQRQGTIVCTVTEPRRFSDDLPQGGLEVPCLLTFRGEPTQVAKVRKLITAVCKPLSRNVPEESSSEEENIVSKKRAVDCHICDPEESKKKRNVDGDTHSDKEDALPQKSWLTLKKSHLTELDKTIIVSGDRLTDKHISFAQTILQTQFVDVLGLQSTILLSKCTNSKLPIDGTSQVLQIIHSRGNHWIVASTIQCPPNTVRIYDSVYSSIDQATLKIIANLFGKSCNVEMGKSPKQQGGADCGVFAIATATSLAHGKPPGKFCQQTSRQHLVECFEHSILSVFP